MINVIVKSRLKKKVIHCYIITLHTHELPSSKRRKGDYSIISVPLEWDFESEFYPDMRKCIHP